jgi:putative transposase
MAKRAVQTGITYIAHACQTFGVSQACYRYRAKASQESAIISDWLVRLTSAYRDWRFGLCFLHLRNVKGVAWNTPRRRIIREVPEPLAAPESANQT